MIPNGVICIPTFRRTEMLALCLEKVSAAEESRDLDIRIFLDHSPPERVIDVEQVRDEYCPNATIFHANPHILCPSGTFNILSSLKQSWETKAPMIYFIEEDILIHPDFFKKHQELQNSDDYFVTCGRKLPQFDDTFYSNPGSAYKREKLGLIVPHINDKYFANQKHYIESNFKFDPSSGILDDGLIRHIMASVGGKAKCAVPAIAFHQGFHYLNRMTEYTVEGTLPEKIEKLRILLTKVKPTDRYTPDFEPYSP